MANDPVESSSEKENGGSAAATVKESIAGGAPEVGPATNGKPDRSEKEEAQKRALFLYEALQGYVVRVKTSDMAVYEGVFSSMNSAELILKMAKLIGTPSGPAPRSTLPERVKVFKTSDWAEIQATDVRIGATDVGFMASADDTDGLGTDAAISRGRGGAQGRELQRWTPDKIDDNATLMHLEEFMGGSSHRGWDQFALNEKKFGVRTNYREELYTTALDPSRSKISMAEAERLAAEIERESRSATGITNMHLLEERGIEVDDDGLDEEDRYGAVLRQGSRPDYNAVGRLGPPSPSAPITIDPRREANKVRAQMTGSVPKATSPYGTPKQLASPLVGDAQKLAALNLDPGVPRVDDDVRQAFEKFKAEKKAAGAVGSGSSLSEFKQFSEQMGSKFLQKTSSIDKGPSSSTSSATTPEPTKKSTLNPNAKAFTWNLNAKEYKPSSSTPPPNASAVTPASTTDVFRPTPPSAASTSSQAPPMQHFTPPSGASFRRGDHDAMDSNAYGASQGPGSAYRQPGRREEHWAHQNERYDRRFPGGRAPPPPPDGGHGHPPPPPPGRSPPTGVMRQAGPSMPVPTGLVSPPMAGGGGPPMAMMHTMMMRPGGPPTMFMTPGYGGQGPMMMPTYVGPTGFGGTPTGYVGGGYPGAYSGPRIPYPPQSAGGQGPRDE